MIVVLMVVEGDIAFLGRHFMPARGVLSYLMHHPRRSGGDEHHRKQKQHAKSEIGPTHEPAC